MKSELQDKLVEVLTSIQAAASKANDFAVEQLPDIAQSYIMYGQITCTLASALFLVLTVTCVALAVHMFRNDNEEYLPGPILFGLASLLGLAFALPSTVMVWVAPKVWLLKEIAGTLK